MRSRFRRIFRTTTCDLSAGVIVELSASMLMDWIFGRCLGCGRGGPRICASCALALEGQRCPNGMWRVDDQALPFFLRGLYRWDETDAVSASRLRSVILSSKSGPSTELIRAWTGRFVATALREGSRFTHVVNPPGRSGLWEPDHSGALAAEIASVLELEHFKGVCRSKGADRRQKEKGREERLFTGHLSVVSEAPREASWLFVDDVVATGGTASRVWTALGKPRRFEAWAVAWRVRQL